MRLGLSLGLSSTSASAFTFANSEAETYVAAMTVEPDDTRKGLIDDLVGSLKSDGIWTKLDWLCLLAAHDSQAARLNAVNTAKSLTATLAPTFTTDRGYTGNGTNAFLDLGEAFGAGANLFSLNSATVGVWCNQQSATAGAQTHVGEYGGTDTVRITARNDAGNEVYRANDGTNATLQANPGSRTGHRALSRTGAAVKRGFVAGVRASDLTTASTSESGLNAALLRLASAYSNDRLAAFYSGAGLSDTEVGNMHSRLNTYLTALGAN
jgi:hypothetical protein